MNNLQRILDGLSDYQGHDLTRFCAFVPGYDGVFYGWGFQGEVPDLQPQRVIDFGAKFRQIKPNGNLLIEHTTGNVPIGNTTIDWVSGGRMEAYDGLLSEFNPFNLHENSTWQVVDRCARPWVRPPDMQPPDNDPNPPYIIGDCARGRRFYNLYEIFTYLWVRKEITIAECNDGYDYLTTMAPGTRICMIRQ